MAHVATACQKPFHCDVCGKDFREPFHLTKHQTVHTGEKNYKCSLCGKDFGYAQSLKSKTKSSVNHGGSSASTSNQPPPRLYTCEICWKSFRHHFHLTAHHQAIHEHGGEKLFSCEVCGKAFAYSNSLTRHRLSQHGLARTGPATQPTGSGSGGNTSSLTESEAATNALLHLTPDSGGHGVQQTHSTIAHSHLHSQPAGFSPLFYTPESGPVSSNTSAPPHQHSHYSHSTVGPLPHQQSLSGKGHHIYPGITGNPIHSTPAHVHIPSSPISHSTEIFSVSYLSFNHFYAANNTFNPPCDKTSAKKTWLSGSSAVYSLWQAF
uniref:C2H2-type domain-containing protein n=1 Tax=Electrophorus electricus TaxID=8005 RepID=A0AAY5EHK4_ELEEL